MLFLISSVIARRILITGTDTGVGKTLCARMMAAGARQAGWRVGVMKPVETGWAEETNAGHDATALIEACGTALPLEQVCPYRFADPLAPSMAAARAGVEIDLGLIGSCCRRLEAASDLVLVEGAGGLLAPLNGNATFADLASMLDLALVVVVGSRLGAINHTLLTMETAKHRKLPVLGYVLNHPWPLDPLTAESNRKALAELAGAPCLGTIPYLDPSSQPASEKAGLASLAGRYLALERMGIGPRIAPTGGGSGKS